MEPHYADDWMAVYHGDSRAVMADMEPESVHCVVTSPPYWGLRDYGTATWLGGDEDCDHKAPSRFDYPLNAGLGPTGVQTQASSAASAQGSVYRSDCGKCGAVRQDSQLGLEPTPEEYVTNMVAVFREVWRVLRSDGTVWLNLGDSYAAANPIGRRENGRTRDERGVPYGPVRKVDVVGGVRQVPMDLKPKDLVGIPWRVAFALQADGWYLRSDIIWAKPNPMPESVTDRPTKSHEYLFLLSKSSRYYFDADAVREPLGEWSQQALTADWSRKVKRTPGGQSPQGFVPEREQGNGYGDSINPAGRNIRSVWTIATAPYPGAHFATFPPKLVEPCIKAGCPEGGIVLDPFAGSGTTGMVAQSLSRRAVLIDLSMDYLDQLMERNRDIPLGLEIA